MPDKIELTKRIIDGAVIGPDRYIIWDTKLPGFGLRVELSGVKSFILKYRTKTGVTRKPTVGRYGPITLQEAREKAKGWLYEVSQGGDPSGELQDKRTGLTVKAALERFDSEHTAMKKASTQYMYRHFIEQEIEPALGSKRVDAVTTSDVSKLLHRIGKDHKTKANRVRAILSKFFSLAERWGMRPQHSNPVSFIDKYTENKRHRDLNADELKALSDALAAVYGEVDNVAAITVIRLLLFTGCRRGEILNLKWSEVDLERGLLRLGDSKTGAKTVYLNSAAIDILAETKRVKDEGERKAEVKDIKPCPWVFPSRYRPNDRAAQPMPEWELREVWEIVREKAGLGATGDMKSFRLHDLRHSFASAGAGEGLSLPQIGALLGHTQSRTTERYADLVNGPNRAAAELIGKKIAAAMNAPEKKETDVVPIQSETK